MKLKKVSYSELNAKQKEIYNFQKVAWELSDYWYNCIKLADDWNWADFLAYHIDGQETLKIQLKSRITIDKKYIDRDLFMSFPIKNTWYIIEHDVLLKIVEKSTNWLDSTSWLENNSYSSNAPSKLLVDSLKSYII